jgi:hypothetical protein
MKALLSDTKHYVQRGDVLYVANETFRYPPFRLITVPYLPKSVQMRQELIRTWYDPNHQSLQMTFTRTVLTFTKNGTYIIRVIQLGAVSFLDRAHDVMVVVY